MTGSLKRMGAFDGSYFRRRIRRAESPTRERSPVVGSGMACTAMILSCGLKIPEVLASKSWISAICMLLAAHGGEEDHVGAVSGGIREGDRNGVRSFQGSCSASISGIRKGQGTFGEEGEKVRAEGRGWNCGVGSENLVGAGVALRGVIGSPEGHAGSGAGSGGRGHDDPGI